MNYISLNQDKLIISFENFSITVKKNDKYYTTVKQMLSDYQDGKMTGPQIKREILTHYGRTVNDMSGDYILDNIDIIDKSPLFNVIKEDGRTVVTLKDLPVSIPNYILKKLVFYGVNSYISAFQSWKKLWIKLCLSPFSEKRIKLLQYIEKNQICITPQGNLCIPSNIDENVSRIGITTERKYIHRFLNTYVMGYLPEDCIEVKDKDGKNIFKEIEDLEADEQIIGQKIQVRNTFNQIKKFITDYTKKRLTVEHSLHYNHTYDLDILTGLIIIDPRHIITYKYDYATISVADAEAIIPVNHMPEFINDILYLGDLIEEEKFKLFIPSLPKNYFTAIEGVVQKHKRISKKVKM